MKTNASVLFLIFQDMSYYYWIIAGIKNVNNFQIVRVHPQDTSQYLIDFFCQFQPGVVYKSVAYKKMVEFCGFIFCDAIFIRRNKNKLQSWTKGCRQIHKITRNRFFYGMFYSWFFANFYRKRQNFAFGYLQSKHFSDFLKIF